MDGRMYLWKSHIDPETIDMFLDRLFQEFGSLYDFETGLKDYGMESIKPLSLEKDCTEDCPHLEELDEDIEVLENSLEKKGSANQLLLKEITRVKAKLEKFKQNSIVFSMDDF